MYTHTLTPPPKALTTGAVTGSAPLCSNNLKRSCPKRVLFISYKSLNLVMLILQFFAGHSFSILLYN